MKNLPMADRRLGRSIVITLSTAFMSGYKSLQRQRAPRRAPERSAAPKH